jgi:hypothetical protein
LSFIFRFPPPREARFDGQLTFIPPNISDLRKLVVLGGKCTMGAGSSSITRSFTRTTSAPASYSFPNRVSVDSFNRYPTSLGTAECRQEATIELYLTGNALRNLPRELFLLKGLTVLILRQFYDHSLAQAYTDIDFTRKQPNRLSPAVDMRPYLVERA